MVGYISLNEWVSNYLCSPCHAQTLDIWCTDAYHIGGRYGGFLQILVGSDIPTKNRYDIPIQYWIVSMVEPHIDHVHVKAWSSKNLRKVATVSSFVIVYLKKWGKKFWVFYYKNLTWAAQLAMEWNVMYFYLVTYFMTTMVYLSVQFLHNIILKIFLA